MATSSWPAAPDNFDVDHTGETGNAVPTIDKALAALNALQGTLGSLPQGDEDTVADRLAAISAVADAAQTLAEAVESSRVQDEGVALAKRKHLNFVGAGVTATDDAGGDRSVITIPGASAAGRDITSFGAAVDARRISGVSVNGTALTAATSMFLPADVGKTVVLYKLLGAGVLGKTTIAGYTSATSVTLASGALTTTAGTRGAIGTDDTTAWQNAINWAYAQPYGGLITCLAGGISLIAGPQQTGTVTSTNGAFAGNVYSYSGQLLLPPVPLSGGQAMPICEIAGPLPPAGINAGDLYGDLSPSTTGLVMLFTTDTGYCIDVISDPNGFIYNVGAYSYIQFNARRVSFRKPYNATGGAGGLNLLGTACMDIDESNIDVDYPENATHIVPTPGPTSHAGVGLIMSGDQNWGIVRFTRSQITGFAKGITSGEHAFIHANIHVCGAALAPGALTSLGAGRAGRHETMYDRVLIQNCNTYIEPLSIRNVSGRLEIETPYEELINDPNGLLQGDLLVSGGQTGEQGHMNVRACGGNLIIRSTANPYAPGLWTPVLDSLITRGPLNHNGNPVAFGLTDGSHHAWLTSNFRVDTNGAYGVSGLYSTAVIRRTPAWTSRKISATIRSSTTAARTFMAIMIRTPVSGLALPLVALVSNSTTPGVSVAKFSTALVNNAMTIVANTTYVVDVYVQSSPLPGSVVLVTVVVNGVKVCSTYLSAANAALYPVTGLDGLMTYTTAGFDDALSRIKAFSVVQAPDLPYVSAGTATLVGGTIAIADTAITATSRVRLTNAAAGGTVGALSVALNAGVGFTINSSSGADTSTVYYEVASY